MSNENNFLKCPVLGFDDLESIKKSNNILKNLEQVIHNLGIVNRSARYEKIFKILIIKYFDETQNKNNKNLTFQIFSDETDDNLYKRIKNLYKEARIYYTTNSPIQLNENLDIQKEILFKAVELLQGFSFIKTNQLIIQNFFMNFAPIFLKRELDQYYTPLEIVEFMSEIVEIKETTTAIDTAGGSADFLVALIKKGVQKEIKNIKQNIHYWDTDEDAGNVASLNMILQGEGRSNIKILDSIEEHDKKNNTFDLCLTNPPFGERTRWSKDLNVMKNYDLAKVLNNNNEVELIEQQLGILFIERNMNILKKGGILEIILPNGYLTNPSQRYIREYLFENFRIVANIQLPENVFKISGAGGNTNILIIKKEKINKDYKIFIDCANKIGFEYDKKLKGKEIYKKNKETGDILTDDYNNPLIENELLDISIKFKQFTFDEKIKGFEKENKKIDYNYVMASDILKEKNLIFSSKRYKKEYVDILKRLKKRGATTLKKIKAQVQNCKSFEKVKSNEYIYIDTRELETGGYRRNNKKKGWELPARAKQSVEKNDILIAKLEGSIGKFCMVLEDNKNLVASNGFWKVRIKDEKDRLNFYSYLFTDEAQEQLKTLGTGSIMADVKDFDIINNFLIPTDEKEKNYNRMKKFIQIQKQLLLEN